MYAGPDLTSSSGSGGEELRSLIEAHLPSFGKFWLWAIIAALAVWTMAKRWIIRALIDIDGIAALRRDLTDLAAGHQAFVKRYEVHEEETDRRVKQYMVERAVADERLKALTIAQQQHTLDFRETKGRLYAQLDEVRKLLLLHLGKDGGTP